MTLQKKLDELRAGKETKIHPEQLTIMHRATKDLEQSGIMNQILCIGDTAPEFVLNDQNGNEVSSTELLKKGPLVISFYRGLW